MPKKAPRKPAKAAPPPPEVVDPRWILKALILIVIASVFCGYLTLCLLFYQGQWQLVLHPSTAVPQTPAALSLQFQPVNFAVDGTGQPQLTGWYVPAPTGGPAILYLHDGDSTISAALPRIHQLHDLGFSVFTFDYRGYGASTPKHPSQSSMQEDAEHALTWLTTSRQLPAQQIIPYGVGVGASLAVTLAAAHPNLPALILEDPKSDLLPVVAKDERTQYIPLSILFHDRFPLAPILPTLHQPKLLLTSSDADLPLYRTAADPKRIAQLPASGDAAIYTDTLRRFSEEYLHQPVPAAAPTSK